VDESPLAIFDTEPDDGLSQTRILPTIGTPSAQRERPQWVTRLARPWLLVAALAVVLIVVIAVATSGGPTVHPPRSPAYPSVPGPLGSHLRQLQQDVAP
jgi:hypothetical protein